MNQDVDVIVVGAGPVGLVLAAELALTGATATVQVLEPRVEPDTAIRAQLINVSTAEALDLVDHGHGGGFLLLDRTPDGAFARLATAWAGRVNSDAEYARLKPLVETWVQEPTTLPWGNRSMLIRDPDGNLVNLYQPSPTRRSPASPGGHRRRVDRLVGPPSACRRRGALLPIALWRERRDKRGERRPTSSSRIDDAAAATAKPMPHYALHV